MNFEILKVRDDLPLSVLYKYGFDYEPMLNKYIYFHVSFFSANIYFLTVNIKTREIKYLYGCPYWEESKLLLYKNRKIKKMIKDGVIVSEIRHT